MKDDLYQNSLCLDDLHLHDYRIVETKSSGVIEICCKCGDVQLFSNNVPNLIYLSYHLRSALPKDNNRFNKEYGR